MTTPPLPERVRRVGEESIAFIPHRFLREGVFASLTQEGCPLYPRSRPLVTQEDLERDDGATIRAALASALHGDGEEP